MCIYSRSAGKLYNLMNAVHGGLDRFIQLVERLKLPRGHSFREDIVNSTVVAELWRGRIAILATVESVLKAL
jgi:hypothetical protein